MNLTVFGLEEIQKKFKLVHSVINDVCRTIIPSWKKKSLKAKNYHNIHFYN